ncbi:DUF4303 domain-containing protein [Leifsonia sp. 21MFCrub1.1]|uniref:DUF4303 domain-containing protein n=1 Tax=Leifsonia sp. 21MFCrub1.1 TaxID=1798223 RepID=UPI000892918B|nr:DUF4303 domain-containing protein [Leifsonia sp. 21MFCrub1.1]SEA43249.1 protein of unknown function [Leifsonia sp. 21MFCrub1.1]
MDDVAQIRSALRCAARSAWTALRAERPDETFYYFGLWTTPLAHRPAPTACSFEGLERAVEHCRAEGVEVAADELRWAVNDSPYDLYGDSLFVEVELLFDAFDGPYDRTPELTAALLDAMIGALADLDAEGFFGGGAARDAVVLNVTTPGHDTDVDLLASARRINPPTALVRYESDVAPDGGVG